MVAASATAFPGTYASTDNVWVQFYPTLRKETAAVLRLGFVAEAADFLTTPRPTFLPWHDRPRCLFARR